MGGGNKFQSGNLERDTNIQIIAGLKSFNKDYIVGVIIFKSELDDMIGDLNVVDYLLQKEIPIFLKIDDYYCAVDMLITQN